MKFDRDQDRQQHQQKLENKEKINSFFDKCKFTKSGSLPDQQVVQAGMRMPTNGLDGGQNSVRHDQNRDGSPIKKIFLNTDRAGGPASPGYGGAREIERGAVAGGRRTPVGKKTAPKFQ